VVKGNKNSEEKAGLGTTVEDDCSEHLEMNTDHSIYYATSVDPFVKIPSFIVSKRNTAGIRSSQLVSHLNEINLALRQFNMVVRAEVSDSAGSNQTYKSRMAVLLASDFIPEELLDGGTGKRSLKGDVKVAYYSLVDDGTDEKQPNFQIDDLIAWAIVSRYSCYAGTQRLNSLRLWV
jgi:hypothetical protein